MFADGAGTTAKMVTSDDVGLILALNGDFMKVFRKAIYGDCVEVFSKAMAETLPPHRLIDHAIDLEPGYNVPYGRFTIERN